MKTYTALCAIMAFLVFAGSAIVASLFGSNPGDLDDYYLRTVFAAAVVSLGVAVLLLALRRRWNIRLMGVMLGCVGLSALPPDGSLGVVICAWLLSFAFSMLGIYVMVNERYKPEPMSVLQSAFWLSLPCAALALSMLLYEKETAKGLIILTIVGGLSVLFARQRIEPAMGDSGRTTWAR